MKQFRISQAPLEDGTAKLVAALLRRLGTNSVTLDVEELEDVKVIGTWDYARCTVELEVTR